MQELSQTCSQFHDPCSATSFVEVIAFDQSENLCLIFFPLFFILLSALLSAASRRQKLTQSYWLPRNAVAKPKEKERRN